MNDRLLASNKMYRLSAISTLENRNMNDTLLNIRVMRRIILNVSIFTNDLRYSFIMDLISGRIKLRNYDTFASNGSVNNDVLKPSNSPMLTARMINLHRQINLDIMFVMIRYCNVMYRRCSNDAVTSNFCNEPQYNNDIYVIGLSSANTKIAIRVSSNVIRIKFRRMIINLHINRLP